MTTKREWLDGLKPGDTVYIEQRKIGLVGYAITSVSPKQVRVGDWKFRRADGRGFGAADCLSLTSPDELEWRRLASAYTGSFRFGEWDLDGLRALRALDVIVTARSRGVEGTEAQAQAERLLREFMGGGENG